MTTSTITYITSPSTPCTTTAIQLLRTRRAGQVTANALAMLRGIEKGIPLVTPLGWLAPVSAG